jgi:hypothetical protein
MVGFYHLIQPVFGVRILGSTILVDAGQTYLMLTANEIKSAGRGFAEIVLWFLKHEREIGIVELWRETHYDKQFFNYGDLDLIEHGEYATQEDKDALIDRPVPKYIPPIKKRNTGGFVYLIKSSEGYYKIGKSKKPEDRMRLFGIKLPFRVDPVHLIHCQDMHAVETELHERYAHARADGEWFTLTDEEVEEIKILTEL